MLRLDLLDLPRYASLSGADLQGLRTPAQPGVSGVAALPSAF